MKMSRQEAIEKINGIKNLIGHYFMSKNQYHTAYRKDCDKVLDCLITTAKQVKEVREWLINSINSTSSTPGKVSFIDGKIDAWEEILEILTEND